MNSMAEAPQLINPISPNAEISDNFNGLLPLLQRLDRLIQKAVAAFQSHEEGALKLSSLQQTDISAFDNTSVPIREDSTLAWLQKTFELSAFDLDLLALSIAPELDRQYVRIYVYLQDDITQKRPTVDLALNFLLKLLIRSASRIRCCASIVRCLTEPFLPTRYSTLLKLLP